MAEYRLQSFAQSGNAYKAALMPQLCGTAWGEFTNLGARLERIEALAGWVHPYEPMPGHPRPDAGRSTAVPAGPDGTYPPPWELPGKIG